jgi:hypothetical protein
MIDITKLLRAKVFDVDTSQNEADWIVNSFLDSFFKGIYSIPHRSQIS